MKKGVLLATKFIYKAIEEQRKIKSSGGSNDKYGSKYKVLRKSLKSGQNLDKWLKAFTQCISMLDDNLIVMIIKIPLFVKDLFVRHLKKKPEILNKDVQGEEEEEEPPELIDRDTLVDLIEEFQVIMDDYTEFLLNCTSFHNNRYSMLIVDNLLRRYLFQYAPTQLEINDDYLNSLEYPINKREVYHGVIRAAMLNSYTHEILVKMIEISPANVKVINQRLRMCFPTIYRFMNTERISNFMRNILLISENIPTLQSGIFDLILNFSIQLDIYADSANKNDGEGGFSSDDDGDEPESEDEKTGEDDLDEEDEEDENENDQPEEGEEEAPEEVKESEADPKVLLLNEILKTFAEHLQAHSDDSEIFNSLISNNHILNSTHIKYVPSLIFHAVCRNKEYFDWLISFLVLNIFDGQKSNVVRLNCCCLLTILARYKNERPVETEQKSTSTSDSSEVARGNPHYNLIMDHAKYESNFTGLMTPPPSPPPDILEFPIPLDNNNNTMDDSTPKTIDSTLPTLSQTLLLLSQYLHCSLDVQSVGPTFYHITNTILYIFCFRHKELLQLNHMDELTVSHYENANMKWWTIRGGFTRILLSQYSVMELCMKNVVDEFLKICQKYSLFYYSVSSAPLDFSLSPIKSSASINEGKNTGNNSATAVTANTSVNNPLDHKMSSAALMMDMYYFPFDTHILDLDIGADIEPYYREWKSCD